jgi:hypothetical protein
LGGSPATASPILDQINNPTIESVFQARADDYWGQTFTVGLAGTLADIKVDVGDWDVPPVDVNFYLAPVVGGVALFSNPFEITIPSSAISPDGANLGPSFYDWLDLNFSPFNIQVKPGDRFALVFTSPISFEDTIHEEINWFAGADTYGPGTLLAFRTFQDIRVPTQSGSDAAFATYVNVAAVPEPSVLATFCAGLGLIGSALYFGRKKMAAAKA